MPIGGLSGSPNKDYFYTDSFKVLVRSEKEQLVKTANDYPLEDRAVINIYKNDIYGLLRFLKVPVHLLWATAYINDITNPMAYIGDLSGIIIIDEGYLTKIVARNNTTRG